MDCVKDLHEGEDEGMDKIRMRIIAKLSFEK
jgi:hypothetical protein